MALLTVMNTDAQQAAPLTLLSQGAFAVAGGVIQRPGVYDNTAFVDWATPVEQGQSYHADHASVCFQIPADARPLPLAFVHGYGQSGLCWQTTPDGREGFSTLMLRRGFATYVVDLPGRGRAGRTTAETQLAPKADEQLWFDIWRIGRWPEFNDGVQFPTDRESLDQFFRQMTPDLSDHDRQTDIDAVTALFDRIGEGILVTHSAGGLTGWLAAVGNPAIRAVASYEPGGYIFPEGEAPDPMPSLTGTLAPTVVPMEQFMNLTRIPVVLYFGDYIPEEPTDELGGENWRVRLQMGRKFVETINRHGGNASLVELPRIGIRGNTHFMMSDLNNSQLADLLDMWIAGNCPEEREE